MTAHRSAVAAMLAVALSASGCSAGEGPVGTATGPAGGGTPSVTFVGDSWTVGLGAIDTGGYAPLTAEQLGWRYTELGFSGSGYVRPGEGAPFADRIDDAVAGRPSAIVVQGSLNDQAADVDDVAAAARDTLARLREAAGPGTGILVVGAPGCPGCDAGAIAAINDVLVEAADAAGLRFVDPAEQEWVDPDDPGLWADPLHPNDEGYRRMADRLAPLLAELGGR